MVVSNPAHAKRTKNDLINEFKKNKNMVIHSINSEQCYFYKPEDNVYAVSSCPTSLSSLPATVPQNVFTTIQFSKNNFGDVWMQVIAPHLLRGAELQV